MHIDDDDNLNLDAIIEPQMGDEVPPAKPETQLPLAVTILDPIPPLREIRARLVKLGDDDSVQAGADADKNAVLLEDPEGFAAQTAVLSTWAYSLALLFDGRRSAVDAADAFLEKYSHAIQPEQALLLQNELEQAMFLNSSLFEEKLHKRLNDYLEMPSWPAAHAGSAYPADPTEMNAAFEAFFTAPDGPGALSEPLGAPTDSVRAVIVPHIDLRVGGACYAHAYKELLTSSQAELIFILGVAHQSMGDQMFSVSQKDFETPLGAVRTNRDIAKRLHLASQTDELIAEMAHRGEHSVEFQAALIQSLLVQRGGRAVEIVPILCGSIEQFLARDSNPFHDRDFMRFANALRAELETCGRKWCVLCSVDLSHVGPEFGHSSMIDARLLKPLERMDRKMLKMIETLDAESFYEEITRTQNSRHVDAVLSVLTMLSACRWMLKSGRLLQYDQMLKAHSHSAVSYAAMAFDEAGKAPD